MNNLYYHPVWDRKSTSTGYEVTYCPDHPRAWSTGYIYTHILIVELSIGRLRERGEVVHHLNGDRFDNRPENLELTTQSKHLSMHNLATGKKMVTLMCPACGNIFDKEKCTTHLTKTKNKFTCCSGTCRGKFSRRIQIEGVTDDIMKKISNNFIREYTICTKH